MVTSYKIPKSIVGRLGLRYFCIWLWLDRMDKVREFYCILDDKYWNVVTNYIVITFFSVKFYSKSTHITRRICRSPKTCYSRYP